MSLEHIMHCQVYPQDGKWCVVGVDDDMDYLYLHWAPNKDAALEWVNKNLPNVPVEVWDD